jgi:hypothetical protein
MTNDLRAMLPTVLSETGVDKESSLNAIIGGNLPNVFGLTINLQLSID